MADAPRAHSGQPVCRLSTRVSAGVLAASRGCGSAAASSGRRHHGGLGRGGEGSGLQAQAAPAVRCSRECPSRSAVRTCAPSGMPTRTHRVGRCQPAGCRAAERGWRLWNGHGRDPHEAPALAPRYPPLRTSSSGRKAGPWSPCQQPFHSPGVALGGALGFVWRLGQTCQELSVSPGWLLPKAICPSRETRAGNALPSRQEPYQRRSGSCRKGR